MSEYEVMQIEAGDKQVTIRLEDASKDLIVITMRIDKYEALSNTEFEDIVKAQIAERVVAKQKAETTKQNAKLKTASLQDRIGKKIKID